MENLWPTLHWTNLLIIPGLLIGYTVPERGYTFIRSFSKVAHNVLTNDDGRWTNYLESNNFRLSSFVRRRFASDFWKTAFILFGIGWPHPLEANPLNFKCRHLIMLWA